MLWERKEQHPFFFFSLSLLSSDNHLWPYFHKWLYSGEKADCNRLIVCWCDGHGFFSYCVSVFSLPLSPLSSVISDFSAIKICCMESIEMDQREKAPATNLTVWVQSPRTRMAEGKNQLTKIVLWCPHGPHTYMCTLRNTYVCTLKRNMQIALWHPHICAHSKEIHTYAHSKYTNSSPTSTRHACICVYTQKKCMYCF